MAGKNMIPSTSGKIFRYGWLPDLPDHRDHLYAAPGAMAAAPPARVDLRAQVARTGHASLPKSDERAVGGHAVVGVGYDDAKQWFVVRNSWGNSWGMKGYFTLPYAYLTGKNLASDFWTIRVVQ